MQETTSRSGVAGPTLARPGRAPSVLRWVVLCATAEAVGMTGSAAAARLGEDTSWALALVVTGGLVEGLALGVAQAAGFAPWLPRFRRTPYVLVTVAVAGLGWAAGSAPAVLGGGSDGGAAPPTGLVVLGGAALGTVMGALLGAAQALPLRGRLRHPWRWVGANAVAWTPAMALIFLGATSPAASWPTPTVVALGTATGIVAGGTLGLVLGWFLPSLAGPSPHNRVVIAVLGSPLRGLLDRSVVGLRVRGRVTGEVHTLPVMYAEDEAGLVVVPGHPERKRWWRNLREPGEVSLLRDGRWSCARACLLHSGDPGYDEAAVTYRRRWPKVALTDRDLVVRLSPRAPVPQV